MAVSPTRAYSTPREGACQTETRRYRARERETCKDRRTSLQDFRHSALHIPYSLAPAEDEDEDRSRRIAMTSPFQAPESWKFFPSLSTRSSLLSCLVCNPVLREPRSRIAIRVASKAARCNVHSSQLVPRPIARTAHTVGLRWAVKISIIPVLLRFVLASFRVARPWTISVSLTWVVSIPRRQRGRRPVTWMAIPRDGHKQDPAY